MNTKTEEKVTLIFRATFLAGALLYAAIGVLMPDLSWYTGISLLAIGAVMLCSKTNPSESSAKQLGGIFCLFSPPFLAAGFLGEAAANVPVAVRFLMLAYVAAGIWLGVTTLTSALPAVSDKVTGWRLLAIFVLGGVSGGQIGPAWLVCSGALR